jgi:integrase/recombinase XerD
MGDRALVDRFLEMMAAQAGAARNTIAAYRSDLMLSSEALNGRLGQPVARDGIAQGGGAAAVLCISRGRGTARR